jgi:hypothetical protein
MAQFRLKGGQPHATAPAHLQWGKDLAEYRAEKAKQAQDKTSGK